MYLESSSALSVALVLLTWAIVGASIWYVRVPRRRQRVWRILNRSWGTHPAKRFDPLRRSDFVRTAGRVALLALAFLLPVAIISILDATAPSRRYPGWLVAIAGFGMVGAAIATLGALGQLWRAAIFKDGPPPLPFTVLSNDVRVGTAAFVAYDAERGVFAGPFRPEPAFASIYPIVRLLAEAYPDISGPDAKRERLEEYLAKKDGLKLELLDPKGVLLPTGEISILEFGVRGGVEVWRIDVEGELEKWVERGAVVEGG
ncbi:MAG: hypothetical protein HOQ12_09100 [Gemmatimonadaceae bacterium]|nr:hypothetical protein [Gemmatimonadaceae bacterium]NUR19673.1 hypothetical protein [Gemmatimonadaceae bacterium]